MSIRQRLIALITTALLFTACSAAPAPRQLAKDAVTAMGGAEKLQSIQTVSMKGGAGIRMRLGQTQKATDADGPGQLKNGLEIADLANCRRALGYPVQSGGVLGT